MRILRAAAVVIFVTALILNILSNAKYKKQQDTTPPTISGGKEALELTVEQGLDCLKQGLTARDDQDGDLTGKILVASTSYFVKKGTTNVEYVVFDSGNNAATLKRQVTFTDYRSPRIFLTQPLVFYRGDNIRVLSYVTASDCLEGDLTGQVQIVEGSIDQYQPDVYPVVLEVGNSFGDRVRVQVQVQVKSPTDIGPEIALSSYITYLEKGEAFEPKDMIRSVRAPITGEMLDVSNVTIHGSVDRDTPGCYQLTYAYSYEGRQGQSFLTVVVEGE